MASSTAFRVHDDIQNLFVAVVELVFRRQLCPYLTRVFTQVRVPWPRAGEEGLSVEAALVAADTARVLIKAGLLCSRDDGVHIKPTSVVSKISNAMRKGAENGAIRQAVHETGVVFLLERALHCIKAGECQPRFTETQVSFVFVDERTREDGHQNHFDASPVPTAGSGFVAGPHSLALDPDSDTEWVEAEVPGVADP